MGKIYIACPYMVHSGGPDSLEAMCHELRKFGYDAIMWYYPTSADQKIGADTHPLNLRYQNPSQVMPFPDMPGADVISGGGYCVCPEGVPFPAFLSWVEETGLKPIIRWLGVYNYLVANFPPNLYVDFDTNPDCVDGAGLGEEFKSRPDVPHLPVSAYEEWFLREKIKLPEGAPIYPLGEYLKSEFFEGWSDDLLTPHNRRPIVLYNPARDLSITQKLIDYANKVCGTGELIWVPVYKMLPVQVARLMRISRLYVDFGAFPGPERLPREAAVNGCCVITGKRGASRFYDVVKIPDTYKFEHSDENIPRIVSVIRDVVQNYGSHIGQFADFRNLVWDHRQHYSANLLRTFTNIIGPPE